jgi:hypothetical protein
MHCKIRSMPDLLRVPGLCIKSEESCIAQESRICITCESCESRICITCESCESRICIMCESYVVYNIILREQDQQGHGARLRGMHTVYTCPLASYTCLQSRHALPWYFCSWDARILAAPIHVCRVHACAIVHKRGVLLAWNDLGHPTVEPYYGWNIQRYMWMTCIWIACETCLVACAHNHPRKLFVRPWCICMRVCVCVCVYIYIYMHTHIDTHTGV